MLILSRKIDESIILGDNVEIRILDIQDGRVKIGIEAPKEISIIRRELYEEVKDENIEALESEINIKELFYKKK